MTPASSGLLVPQMSKIRFSETWVEGNFVFHQISSFLKNVALVKTNAEKMKQNKADEEQLGHGFGIFT